MAHRHRLAEALKEVGLTCLIMRDPYNEPGWVIHHPQSNTVLMGVLDNTSVKLRPAGPRYDIGVEFFDSLSEWAQSVLEQYKDSLNEMAYQGLPVTRNAFEYRAA